MDERTPGLASQTLEVSSETIAASRRLVGSLLIAVGTSAGLYLIGSVYTDAYYGRMSIEVLSLDLSPPHITLQSAHVLPALLGYPSTILFLYVLYRMLASPLRWLRVRYDWARRRSERLVVLITNLVIITPLILDAIRAAIDERAMFGNSAVSELSSLLASVTMFLVIFTVWLSLGPRALILTEIRQRRIVPIALIVTVYLLGALVTTADAAASAAERYMLGFADSSMTVTFSTRGERDVSLPDGELLLVAARNGNYFVVERQEFPASPRPVSYMIPFDVIDAVQLQRIIPAGLELEDSDLLDFNQVFGVATPAGTP